MNLTPWKSGSGSMTRGRMGDDFNSLQREMNNLVNSFFGRDSMSSSSGMPQMFDKGMFPSIDIVEKDNKYMLDADMPGMSEADIDIDLRNNVLTIKGEKRTESEKKEDDYMCVERSYGSFRRDIPFDDEVDADHIKADLKNGVLHIELPKKEQGKKNHKKIPIKH